MPTSNTAHLLPVAVNQTAMTLAQTMFGDGITVLSASYKGDARSAGVYTSGDTISPDAVPSPSGVILSTGLATQFTNASGATNQTTSRSTDTTGINGDALMNKIAGVATYDAALFEASFVSTGDELSMRLVFASEEYLEWVKSGYNDAVGIWVNGQQVELSLGDGTISIDNINTTSSENLFRDNTDGSLNTEMDGLTYVLTLKAPLLVGQTNTIRIGIADAGDASYDSALLIVADSVQSALIAQDDNHSVTGYGQTTVDLIGNDTTAGREGVHITAINDEPVTAGDWVWLNSGDAVRLEEDGRVTFFSGGMNGPVSISYTITDAKGVADTAFATFDPQAVDGTNGNDAMMAGFVDAEGNRIDGIDGDGEAIYGYGGQDKIFAGMGSDYIYGGTGNDFVRSGDGMDMIDGGDGNDVLDGGYDIDQMDGGKGNDVYYVDIQNDVVIEADNGGYDKVISDVSYDLGAAIEELWLRAGSWATDANGNDLANKIIGNENANTLTGAGGADQIIAGLGDDSVFGDAGRDLLFGNAGADLLDGGEDRDKLFGGAGQDTLSGGAGDDLLVSGAGGGDLTGGAGRDLLFAGSGADVFYFHTGSDFDRLRGFDATEDRLVFDGLQASDVTITERGNQTVLTWGADDRLVIRGWIADVDAGPLPFDFL